MGKQSRNSQTVTWFAARKCWKKYVGGRVFYFGSDQQAAEAEGAAIKARWRRLRMMGHTSWPEGEPSRLAIQDALGIGVGAPLAVVGMAAPVAPPKSEDVEVEASALTVDDAGKLYIADRRANPGKAGDRTLRDLSQRLGTAVDSIGRTKSLVSIRQNELSAFVGSWMGKVKAGDISAVYAANIVKTAKSLLNWCADHDDIAWEKPKRFDTIMLVPIDKPRTSEEMERFKAKAWGEDERHFTVEELKALYAKADVRVRAWMLLGLNCAYYPIDIQRLKATDIRKNGETWIQTVRGKTLVKSRHVLWPETIKAIDESEMLTRARSTVLIARRWDELRTAAKLPDALPFKYLRHTSGNEIKKIAGGEISEIHLAHTEGLKMQGPYTARLWDEHAKATKALRKVFAPIWGQ